MKRIAVAFLFTFYLFFTYDVWAAQEIQVKSVKPVAVGIAKAFSPWSPDSEWICYSNTHYYKNVLKLKNPSETPGVYVIRYDGTGKRLMDPDGKRPSFGRFHNKIVYSKDGTSGKKGIKGGLEEDIWMINFDGTGGIQLTRGETDTRMKIWGGTCLTYDGKHVLYYFLDVSGIGIVNTDGTNPRVLIQHSQVAGFSPDGKKVFITRGDVEEKGFLSGGFMSLEDGSEKWLIRHRYPENDYWHLVMNLQGTMVTYDNPRWKNRNIWVAKLNGSGEARPVTDYKSEMGKPGVPFANHPRFSPDGEWIVYDEQTNTGRGRKISYKNKIMVIKTDGTCKTELAEALIPTHCGYCEPAWSPDGKKIMYYAPDPDNDNNPSVFVIELQWKVTS